MTLKIGQIADNRYRIAEMLAQGGMGAIYRAWDTRLERPIALKEMIPQPGLDEEMLEQLRLQFENEARVLGTLSHSHLVRVTDYFSWEGSVYLVMDFVEGESLADRIARQGAQNSADVIRWARQLLDALAYCHGRGVLHRDIKPQNIVITTDDNAILVDFGLVKLWNPEDPETRTVMRGAGTPEYAPPEQYDMGVGHTDPRSDIYSLGATFYQALTGQAPPTATQRMANPASFVPPRRVNAAISPVVENAILKAMEVAMDRRFQNAQEMAQSLADAERTLGTPTRRVTPGRTVVLPESGPATGVPVEAARTAVPKKRGRRGLLIGLPLAIVLCVAVIAVGAIGVYILSLDDATPTPAVAVGATNTPTEQAYPTATPTTRPTEVPTPIVTSPLPATGDIPFYDDFDSSDSGWEVWEAADGSTTDYVDSTFAIRAITPGWMWGVANREFTDVVIDVDATQISAPANDNNGYGVMCRVQPGGDGYLLAISGDGLFAIYLIADGEFTALSAWSSASAVLTGNSINHIQAICDGRRLAMIVNGQLLGEVEDATFDRGDIALSVNTYEEEESTEIRFDDLIVSPPGSEVLAYDDFSDADSGWNVGDYENGSHGYGDGYYYVTVINEDWMVWGTDEQSYDDVIVDVEAYPALIPANNNNAYGVMCRLQSNDDGYYLRVSSDGYFRVDVKSEGEMQALVEWETSDAILPGDAVNHMRVVCDGTRLALIVNGQLLVEVDDDTFAEGVLGLTATSFEPETTEIRFDRLVVRRRISLP